MTATCEVMDGVREFASDLPVTLEEPAGRPLVVASSPLGPVAILDLLGLLAWVRRHRPDLLRRSAAD